MKLPVKFIQLRHVISHLQKKPNLKCDLWSTPAFLYQMSGNLRGAMIYSIVSVQSVLN